MVISPMPRRQKSGFPWASLSGLQLLCRGVKRGLLGCSQTRAGAERMPPVTVLDGKLQPAKRAVGVTGLQTHCLPWHFLSFSSLPRGGGGLPRWAWAGGHRCCAMESQRQRPFTEDSVHQRLAWCLAGIVYGSLRAFLKTLPPLIWGFLPEGAQRAARTHILAKHFEYPKIGRKDRGLTPPPRHIL